jgi:chromosome segregation ATPase
MKMKLNSFFFSIFLSVNLFGVMLVKDVSNDLHQTKSFAQQVESNAQQVQMYDELKKTLDEMKKQTDMLNKQLESFNGVRTSISSVKKDVYDEVNYWRNSVDSLEESMTKLHKTVASTQDNFTKMVDLSDGNYYNGAFKNDDAEAIIK